MGIKLAVACGENKRKKKTVPAVLLLRVSQQRMKIW